MEKQHPPYTTIVLWEGWFRTKPKNETIKLYQFNLKTVMLGNPVSRGLAEQKNPGGYNLDFKSVFSIFACSILTGCESSCLIFAEEWKKVCNVISVIDICHLIFLLFFQCCQFDFRGVKRPIFSNQHQSQGGTSEWIKHRWVYNFKRTQIPNYDEPSRFHWPWK